MITATGAYWSDDSKKEENKTKKFVSTKRKGFHMTFANGLTASVQWGAGNYCDNHFPYDRDFSCSKDAQSNTAEVAVWIKEKWLNANQFVPEEKQDWCDDVVGWLSPEDVVSFLTKVAEYDPKHV